MQNVKALETYMKPSPTPKPASEGHKITLNRRGTMARTIPLAQVQIPDLWHIAQALPKLDIVNGLGQPSGEAARDKVLDCWHKAHDILSECHSLAGQRDQLLEALQRLLRAFEADVEMCPKMDVKSSWETNSQAIEQARLAISQAQT